MKKYNQYIKQIIETMLFKRKHKMGYLVVGEKQPSANMLQDIMKKLERKKIASYHVNFNQFDDEEGCILALKKAKKEILKKRENMPMLVIESFDRMDRRKIEAIKLIIACQHLGINYVVSASSAMVHLVGLTEYMIRIHPSKNIYSECFHYAKKKVLFSVGDDAFVDSKDGVR